jgi:exosortase
MALGQAGGAPEEAATGARRRPGWGWLACVVLGLSAYRDLLRFEAERELPEELERWFFVPSQSIAPVVLLLSLWLLYRRLRRLRALPQRPAAAWPGGLLLLLGLGVYLWAVHTGARDLLVPSLAANAAAALWLWKGGAAVRVARLPLLVLVFAMRLPAPLFNSIIWQLQLWTTQLSAWMLYLAGIPHHASGERIVRAEHTFSVIESCSGLRSMETLTIVAILMVDLFHRRGWHAWLVVLAAVPIAFLMNGLRAVLLIVNPHSQIAAIHNLQGVVILLGGLIALFLWDSLLEWVPSLRSRPAPPGPPRPPPPESRRGRLLAVAAALAAAVLASFGLSRWEGSGAGYLDVSRRLAAGLGVSRELELDRSFLGSVGFREAFLRSFPDPEGDGPPRLLFVGIGDRGAIDRSPLSPKVGLPGSGWIVEDEGRVTLAPDARPVRARLLRSGTSRQLVLDWYEGAGSLAGETLRSLLALDRSRWGAPQEIVAVRMSTPLVGSSPREREAAQQILVSLYQRLRPLLDGLELKRTGAEKRFS